MMRGHQQAERPQPGAGAPQTDTEVAQLRAELDQLRAAARDREAPSGKSDRPR